MPNAATTDAATASNEGAAGPSSRLTDVIVTPEGEIQLLELNTIPGFTETSVYARLFEASATL